MKKQILIVVLILLIPVAVYAWMGAIMVGGGTPAAGGCATQSIEVDTEAPHDNTITIYSGKNEIQSVIFNSAEDVYSITGDLSANELDADESDTLTVRGRATTCDTSSIYDFQCTGTVSFGDTSFILVCETPRHTAATATTYYLAFQWAGVYSDRITFYRSTTTAYANGQRYYNADGGWDCDSTNTADDLDIQVVTCDP